HLRARPKVPFALADPRGRLARLPFRRALRCRVLARAREETHAVGGSRHRPGVAVLAVVACTRALDGHGLTGFERVAIPALAHQPVRARELEAPFGGLVSVRRSARPLLVAARVPQIAAPAPLAYLARTHVDPRVRIRPLELGHFARD